MGGRRRTETWRVEIAKFRVLPSFPLGKGVSALLKLGLEALEIQPTAQMFIMPLGQPFWVRGGAVPERQA